MHGYSDRINHALAYAAKHHDREVRKGTRLPYVTHAANVGIILTRYGRDEDTVVAGILQDVVADCVFDGWTRQMLDARIGEKFGGSAVDIALSVTRRKLDDEGNELDREERNVDFLARLAEADDRARWICAADEVHTANTTLADLQRTVDRESVWSRTAGGRDSALRWHREVCARLRAVGFDAPIVTELEEAVRALEAAH